jgi:phage terminase large subunit
MFETRSSLGLRKDELYDQLFQSFEESRPVGAVSLEYQEEPVRFSSEVLGSKLWPKQVEILESVRDNPRTAARSCHGVGKSFAAGQVVPWFLNNFYPSIVITTAPTWRQVEKLTWKEIRASYRRARVPLKGVLLPKRPEIQIIQDEWYAVGLSTKDPDRFQGFHEEHILVVVDEAAGVSEEIFEAIEGVLTSEHARLLLLGNPTMIGGTFYNAFGKQPGWQRIHISAFDTPNFVAFGITEEDIASGEWEKKITGPLPNPKLITPAWVADKYVKWGPNSPAYQARCKGDFPTEGEDTLIPLAWIEAAMERWEDTPETDPVELGVDVARFGSDKTVIAPRKGRKVLPLEVYAKQDTMETAGKSIIAYRREGASIIKVDVIGLGGGVVDRIAEQGFPVAGINVAEAANEPERFPDLRSELWWNLREQLDPNPLANPDPIALPPDDDLLADLSGIKYKNDSRGRTRVEAKDDMKKRLGRSPDRGDAVVLAFAPTRDRGDDLLW